MHNRILKFSFSKTANIPMPRDLYQIKFPRGFHIPYELKLIYPVFNAIYCNAKDTKQTTLTPEEKSPSAPITNSTLIKKEA